MTHLRFIIGSRANSRYINIKPSAGYSGVSFDRPLLLPHMEKLYLVQSSMALHIRS